MAEKKRIKLVSAKRMIRIIDLALDAIKDEDYEIAKHTLLVELQNLKQETTHENRLH